SSKFVVTNNGTVLASKLTTFSAVQITLDGTGTVATSQWNAITRGGSLTVTGGLYAMTGLTNMNGSALYAESGASLGLPNLITYDAEGDEVFPNNSTFEATGMNSSLNLSALTTLGNLFGARYVNVLDGGRVTLS